MVSIMAGSLDLSYSLMFDKDPDDVKVKDDVVTVYQQQNMVKQMEFLCAGLTYKLVSKAG